MKQFTYIWRLWAKALGVKPDGLSNREADIVALVRTLVLGLPGLCIILNTGRNFGLW
jgi:hypothetical protein